MAEAGVRTIVCTIVSKNYLAHARTVMASVAAVHPDWERVVLLVDEVAHHFDPAAEAFELVLYGELGLLEPRKMAFRYGVLELNTAVKPAFLQRLFERGADRVVYLDPDVMVHGPLTLVEQALDDGASFALTPHLTAPLGDGLKPDELDILRAGVHNLGFLSLRRDARSEALLSWWAQHMRRECVVDLPAGLFVDQRWMDLAPGMFGGSALIRDPGYNAAYWNLRHRRIERARDGWQADGRPLAFFHWSGFDPLHPERLSIHQDRFASTAELGDVEALALEYAERLHQNGYTKVRDWPYAFGCFSNGRPIPPAVRHCYRTRPGIERSAGDDPFRLTPERFNEPAPELGLREPVITLAMASEWERRTDLRRSFPDLGGPKKAGAQRTAYARAWRELIVPSDGIPEEYVLPMPEDGSPGVNLVGYFSYPKGVGEAARRCAEVIGVPTRRIDCAPERLAEAPIELDWDPAHPINLLYVNADMLPSVQAALPSPLVEDAYQVGIWHWELPVFPEDWRDRFARVDELWAPSRFVQEVLAPVSPVPVLHMPHSVEVRVPPGGRRSEFGIPESAFAFLAMYDQDSVQARKNPHAAIEAFRKAFPSDGSVALVVKVHHSERNPRDREALARAVAGDERVILIDGTLSRDRSFQLIDLCDAFVSLHRSEGFGLICAEAMALGKPVVATGWSGNMDFMDASCACPVRARLVELPRSYGPYAQGQRWADPDVDHAASLLRRLVVEPGFADRIGAAAAQRIRTRLSPERIGARYRARLREIHRWRSVR